MMQSSSTLSSPISTSSQTIVRDSGSADMAIEVRQ
jgi:hypothetical protein